MNKLLSTCRALCGRDVCLRVENHKLLIIGDESFLQSFDLIPIKNHKALLIDSLPCDVDVTPRQIVDAIEAYIERVAIMEYDGLIDRSEAEAQAMKMIRRYIHSAR